ncbi:hypothetical protein SAMN05216480_10615 [Pustulibacterium marinum]|uniref:Uncharacterized protein n=1 Tax=Pustulibacterium marinum TaxID=1224947 RepID=A0A1I7GVH3_9FLAO|nr:hypothetical protein [Pustulibacterium marinum]SFU52409.1 hypothetical protein SAMN05216480_10615 [Pustulibacterium marinum]
MKAKLSTFLFLIILGSIFIITSFTLPTDDQFPHFDIHASFEITELQKKHHKNAQNDVPECLHWELEATTIKKILPTSRIIVGSEWHHLFDHYACGYELELLQNNVSYTCTVNGGAWFTIEENDALVFYGSFEDDINSYFISGPWKEEE